MTPFKITINTASNDFLFFNWKIDLISLLDKFSFSRVPKPKFRHEEWNLKQITDVPDLELKKKTHNDWFKATSLLHQKEKKNTFNKYNKTKLTQFNFVWIHSSKMNPCDKFERFHNLFSCFHWAKQRNCVCFFFLFLWNVYTLKFLLHCLSVYLFRRS